MLYKWMSFLTLLSVFIVCTMALAPSLLPIESKDLFVPSLKSVAEVLKEGLISNFAHVTVEVVACPDLTQEPFTLASKGLGGNPKIIELGGSPYLLPLVKREKIYDLKEIVKLVGSDPAFIIGAGAGPNPFVGVNCEGIYNLNITNGTVDQHSRISKVDENERSEQIALPNTETRLALLGNLLFTEGKPGPVIKVHVKKRIGEDNFISSMRKALENKYQDKHIGMGGVFLLKEGKAKQHVMRDFTEFPISNEEELDRWLKFFEMSAPLIAVGTFVNADMDLDLRVQHFHSFSHHGEAGHYHYDTTPDIVEYLV